jgi:hypothetical protein
MPEGTQNIMHDGTNMGKQPILHEFGSCIQFQHRQCTVHRVSIELSKE